MRDPSAHTPLYGLLAEFDDADKLVSAAQRTRAEGYRRIDGFSPFPVSGLAEALAFRENRIPLLGLAGGFLGAALGLGMQIYTNEAYPLNVGGRPLLPMPAFTLICFELMVLGAVGFAVFGMLLLNRLPRLHHPLFGAPSFHLATMDKFFLVILGDDPKFDPATTRSFLQELDPIRVDDVEQTEEPE